MNKLGKNSRKHSIFRTAFIWESLNKPVQVVYKQVKITVENDDWQGLSDQEQQEQLKFFFSRVINSIAYNYLNLL